MTSLYADAAQHAALHDTATMGYRASRTRLVQAIRDAERRGDRRTALRMLTAADWGWAIAAVQREERALAVRL